MTSIRCSHIMTSRNIFLRVQRHNLAPSLFNQNLFSAKTLHVKAVSLVPIKLAYASYESMQETGGALKHPIIIMHGLFGSKNNWNSLCKAIHQQTKRKVIAVDARNHGDSPHSTKMTYKHMAEDIVQLMNDLGFEKSILIGHSMGGSTMMYMALHYPKLVEKLIVVDMSPVKASPILLEMINIFHAMRSVRLTGFTTLSKARKMVDEQLSYTVKSQALRQFLLMNLVEADAGRYKWRVNLPVLEQNFPTQIAVFPNIGSATFAGPTLFIGGAKSDFIRVEDHSKIKELFPTAKFQYIADANHWVHADKPAEFLKITNDFINQ